MTTPRPLAVPRELIVPIIHDGAIAGPIAEGRLLPVLLLDSSKRPDFAELLRVHEHLGSGDVEFDWALSADNADETLLFLQFQRPIKSDALLLFDVRKQAILVEAMLRGGGVYLQDAQPGDRLLNTLDAHRLLVELPETGFRPHWDRYLMERTTALMRSRGVPRRNARSAALASIEKMRKVCDFRMSSTAAGASATSGLSSAVDEPEEAASESPSS